MLASFPSRSAHVVLTLSLLLLFNSLAPAAESSPVTRLAADGKALQPIVIAEQATPRVKKAAETLAQYLGQIASAPFEVTTGNGTIGIAVGQASDFPELKLSNNLNAEGPARLEQYLLRSHERGLYVIGASELAVEHAVWDLLYRLGHRQFFPGEVWEVVPNVPTLEVAVDALELPDYYTRRIWFSYGGWKFNDAAHAEWRARNRAEGTFQLNTGHAYDGILREYKEVFDQHPEYLGLVDGERKSTKFCIGNPRVRTLVVRYARDFFAERPEADSVSIDPSDGGGWCECEACAAVGSPSDRALLLANEISKVLEAEYPGKYVALYAYNYHSPPPSLRARPRVIVNAATAFLKGMSIDQVIDGWKAQGIQQFGIREYYSINTWDRDLPGQARGAKLDYLQRTIPSFHERGARFMSAESSDNWGPNGLGYYLASRMLWDVDEAKRLEELKADFYAKAFGPAREPMERFYTLLDGSQPPLLSSDLLARMYGCLDEAGKLAGDDERIRTRLDHLILYTRYVELFRTYSTAKGDTRQAAFERLIRHAYRMSDTMMIHSLGLYRDLPNRDKSVKVPADAHWRKPEGENPWKDKTPWTRQELASLVAAGLMQNELAGFDPVGYGHDLVPIDALNLPEVPPLNDSLVTRGTHVYYTWIAQPPATIELQVTGGRIAHYRDRGDVQLLLYAGPPQEGANHGEDEEPLDRSAVPPDGEPREVPLKTEFAGLHRLWLNDGMDATEVRWPDGLHRTWRLDAEANHHHVGARQGYFYVPRGTQVVGGYCGGRAEIHDAEGKLIHTCASGEYFSIPVPPGHDGRLWSLRKSSGPIGLMTVPPYLARSRDELLLPREVVAADQAKP